MDERREVDLSISPFGLVGFALMAVERDTFEVEASSCVSGSRFLEVTD